MSLAPKPTIPVIEPGARASASLLLVRDGPRGLEVLMGRRAERPGDQNSGVTVFPGGLVDPGDWPDAALSAQVHGLDDAQASARLGLAAGGLAYAVAAVRECFEEAGVLLARTPDGGPVRLPDEAEAMALRQALHGGRLGMAALAERLGLQFDLSGLAYFSHWVTPRGLPKIFDTRFFIAQAPAGQAGSADGQETVALMWLRPEDALHAARGLKLLLVTERTLQQLQTFARAADAVAWARAQPQAPFYRPRMGRTAHGSKLPVPAEHPAFAEIGRLDASGRGDVSLHLQPGRPVWLSPRVCRVTAPNGSLMTGPGTNSYFVGSVASGWALIDPGPDDAAHLDALRAAAPGRITRILVTHTHPDHSPAARILAAEWSVPRLGRRADHPQWQDASFEPDEVLAEGQRLSLCEGENESVREGDGEGGLGGVHLRVLHTPGHASNHLCFLLEEEKLLFTGDHLMQGSTVVINPPDGDMAVYLRSLERLLAEDLHWLAPGHGFLIDQPHALVRKVIAHRQAREAKVLAALRGRSPSAASGSPGEPAGAAAGRLPQGAPAARAAAAEPAEPRGLAVESVVPSGVHTESALLAAVYADTPAALHKVARRSLRAHLLKLQHEGRVEAVAIDPGIGPAIGQPFGPAADPAADPATDPAVGRAEAGAAPEAGRVAPAVPDPELRAWRLRAG